MTCTLMYRAVTSPWIRNVYNDQPSRERGRPKLTILSAKKQPRTKTNPYLHEAQRSPPSAKGSRPMTGKDPPDPYRNRLLYLHILGTYKICSQTLAPFLRYISPHGRGHGP